MQLDLSIVIVNYNVMAFLKQCLFSIQKATQNLRLEIFVVDNNSVDNSVLMLKKEFPGVKIIENHQNKGFATACNQAIKISKGKYILLLNPDTVIREDSLISCCHFMEKNIDAGAIGVKMIDGKGKFLPESKRSLPTTQSAFFKIFGFSRLFPKSKLFGKYQLNYLDKDQTHQVDILSGAYMFIRKSVLDKIGLLDENFFMYGEDIDLSYRIILEGYKNYYFSDTTIIHYKGESTKKASVRYVKIFYNAMLIFANKHYKGKKQLLFRFVIQLAIYFRATLAIINRLVSSLFLPIIDFLSIYFAYYILIPIWEFYKFSNISVYNENLLKFYVPLYIIIWQIFIFYFTRYKTKVKSLQIIKAITLGTITILSIYSLLPEDYRYSRALIIFGLAIALINTIFIRLLIRFFTSKPRMFSLSSKKKALLICKSRNNLIEKRSEQLENHYDIINYLEYNNKNKDAFLSKLKENIKIYKLETIIFYIKDISPGKIIETIISIASMPVEFKIMLPDSRSLVGSNSVIDINELSQFKIAPITSFSSKLKKRGYDIILCIVFIVFTPVFLFKNKPKLFYKIIWEVFTNKLTWVSYMNSNLIDKFQLPEIQEGVFQLSTKNVGVENLYNIEQYAKNYQIKKDIIIIFNALKTSLAFTKHFNRNIQNK